MIRDQVNDAMLRLMDETNRRRYGGVPVEVIVRKGKRDPLSALEKKEHVILENWLNQHELFYDHQRMDKRATNKKGIPDFIIGIWGLLICIEFKRPGCKLTPEQEHWRQRALTQSRCQYHVCATAGEAIRTLNALP